MDEKDDKVRKIFSSTTHERKRGKKERTEKTRKKKGNESLIRSLPRCFCCIHDLYIIAFVVYVCVCVCTLVRG